MRGLTGSDFPVIQQLVSRKMMGGQDQNVYTFAVRQMFMDLLRQGLHSRQLHFIVLHGAVST